MTLPQLMAGAVFTPLVGALLIALVGRKNGEGDNLRDTLTVIISLMTFGFVAQLAAPVLAGERPELLLLQVIPGVDLAFKLEPLGMLFALVAAGLWIPTSIFAFGYMRGNHEKHQTRFFICFAMAIFAALGIAFAANLVTLFLFYELMTFSTYPLVTHAGTAKAIRSGRIYLGVLVFTSVSFLLLGILWTFQATGTTEFTAGGIVRGHFEGNSAYILLALFVFGTGKAAVMPFHKWLPNAMVAPTPVSALLHAVAVVKAGVFTVLKVSVYTFGPEYMHESGISTWLIYVAAFTIVAASLIAMTKDNLKARLAYSTVSQLSYIVLAAMLANSWGVFGGGLHLVTHAVGKITLFFCAGAIYTAVHKTEISELDGLGRRMPLTFAAFLIGSLSIIGLPPMGGSWSKWYLMLGAADAGLFIILVVFMLSSLLSVAYLLPIPFRAFLRPAKEEPEKKVAEGHETSSFTWSEVKEASFCCVAPPVATALGCIALFFYGDTIMSLINQIPLS
jgi:multicomponent Na+:H+ antiporter subunit D